MPTYGLLEPPAEEEVVEGGESHSGGDLGAPGGPHHQADLSALAVRHHAGTHGGQRPLARSDKVVRGGREVKPVGDVGEGEVVHLVVEENSCRYYYQTESFSQADQPVLGDKISAPR